MKHLWWSFLAALCVVGCSGQKTVSSRGEVNSSPGAFMYKGIFPVYMPDGSIVSEISDDEVKDRLRTNLAEAKELKVWSRQKVTYAKTTPAHGPVISRVVVTVESHMTADSLAVQMWNESVSNQPLTILSCSGGPDSVTTESHFYPMIGEYSTVSYPSPNGGHVSGLRPSALFGDLKSHTCATAEFHNTWLGERSYQGNAFCQVINESDGRGLKIHNGVPAYHFVREAYRDKGRRGSDLARTDDYWIDARTFYPISRRTVLADIMPGVSESSQTIERAYFYARQ